VGNVLDSARVEQVKYVEKSVDCGSLVIFGLELAVDEAFFWYGGAVLEDDESGFDTVVLPDHFIDPVAQLTREREEA